MDGDHAMDTMVSVADGDAPGVKEDEEGVEGGETRGICETVPM